MVNKIWTREYITQHTAFIMLPYSMKCLSLITKHAKYRYKYRTFIGKNIRDLATFILCLLSSRTWVYYLLMWKYRFSIKFGIKCITWLYLAKNIFWNFLPKAKMSQFRFGWEKKVAHRKHRGNISGYHRKGPTNYLKS